MFMMLGRKFLLSVLICFAINLFGQESKSQYLLYPKFLEPYKGGKGQFYKDFHKILMSKKLKPCENKSEAYYLKVLINEDASIQQVNDQSEVEIISKNKCAYELSTEVIRFMDKWNPAVVNGIKKRAVAGFFIVPDDLFKKYEEGYVPHEDVPSLKNSPNGFSGFREEVVKRIKVSDFKWNKEFKIVVHFDVTKEGKIENVLLDPSSGVKEFDNRIITAIESFKNEWNPALKEGIPVDYKFRLPLNFGAK